MMDWSELPRDLLALIAKRVAYIDDFLVFGAVCKSWQQAAGKENFNNLSQVSQVPWLIVPKKKGSSSYIMFHPSKGAAHQISIPEICGKICFASQGWIVITSKDWSLSLLHPLSRTSIKLPRMQPHKSIKLRTASDVYCSFVQKVAISSKPSHKRDFSVMVIHEMCTRLAYLGPGGKTWIQIHNPRSPGVYRDVIYYNSQFYVVDCTGTIMACDVKDSKQIVARAIARLPITPREGVHTGHYYLVESEGKLLMVAETSVVEIKGNRFQVFHVDFNNGGVSWKEIESLGDTALFLGVNTSFSIKASLSSGCKPNCIYVSDYTCYHWYVRGGLNTGIYSMADGRMKPYLGPKYYGGISTFAPLWVTLDF